MNYTCIRDQKSLKPNNFALGQAKIKNQKCVSLEKKYPLLTNYYQQLFSEKLGFKKIAEFNSYPNLKFRIYNLELRINFEDEDAEETWTVFDHPVIRIYKRI